MILECRLDQCCSDRRLHQIKFGAELYCNILEYNANGQLTAPFTGGL